MHDRDSCHDGSSLESIIVGTGLTIGILISYLPQIFAVMLSGTSEGLNYVTMWLSFIAGYMTLINAILLQWDKIACAQYLGIGQNFANLLPLEQLVVGPLCQYILYIFTVVYFPQKAKNTDPKSQQRHYYISILMLVIAIVYAIALAGSVVALVANVDSDSTALKGYASSLGIISALITIAFWLPQIYTTWKLKDPGALSIWMLLLQMPGAVMVVYFQGIVNSGDWTTWVPYVAQAIQQSVLIFLYFWFRCCSVIRRSRSTYALHDVMGDEERSDSTHEPTVGTDDEQKPFLAIN